MPNQNIVDVALPWVGSCLPKQYLSSKHSITQICHEGQQLLIIVPIKSATIIFWSIEAQVFPPEIPAGQSSSLTVLGRNFGIQVRGSFRAKQKVQSSGRTEALFFKQLASYYLGERPNNIGVSLHCVSEKKMKTNVLSSALQIGVQLAACGVSEGSSCSSTLDSGGWNKFKVVRLWMLLGSVPGNALPLSVSKILECGLGGGVSDKLNNNIAIFRRDVQCYRYFLQYSHLRKCRKFQYMIVSKFDRAAAWHRNKEMNVKVGWIR